MPITLAVFVIMAFILLQPSQKAWAQKILPPMSCRYDIGVLLDATDMNTILTESTTGPKVWTIHVEKEVFDCQVQIAPNVLRPVIVDVSIYTEIIERAENAVPIKKFEVVTCEKDAINGNVLGCARSDLRSTNLPTVSSCQSANSALPIDMNTVVEATGVVKTIEAQKEIFRCDTPPNAKTVKDVTIFTEIIEDVTKGIPIQETYETVICLKEIASAKVIACNASPPKLF
jgi:hypothetical protein